MDEQIEQIPDGLPKVAGLERVFQDDPVQDKGRQVAQSADEQIQAPVVDGQAGDDDELPPGFKNPKEMLKSYKEIQGFTTRISQENKQLKDELQRLKEEAELRQYQHLQTVMPNKTWDELYMENPEQAIAIKANEMATTQRIAEVLEEKESENPEEFQERLVYVKMLAQRPDLTPLSYSPKGVKKLFEMADKTRKEQLTKKAHESLKAIFGEDIDIEKFKAIVKKDTQTTTNQPTTANPLNAYMPDTRTSTRTGADINININDLERRKAEAIKAGDAKTVAGLLLRQAFSK